MRNVAQQHLDPGSLLPLTAYCLRLTQALPVDSLQFKLPNGLDEDARLALAR